MHASFDRWWNGISLRAKITGVTVLLLTFGLTVAGAGTMTVLRTYLLDQTDQQIAAAYEKLPPSIDLATIEAYGDGTRLNPFYLAAVSPGGNIMVDNLTDEQAALLPDTTQLTTEYVTAHQHEPITLYNDSHSAQWRVIPISGEGRRQLEASDPARRAEHEQHRRDHRAVHRHLPRLRSRRGRLRCRDDAAAP